MSDPQLYIMIKKIVESDQIRKPAGSVNSVEVLNLTGGMK